MIVLSGCSLHIPLHDTVCSLLIALSSVQSDLSVSDLWLLLCDVETESTAASEKHVNISGFHLQNPHMLSLAIQTLPAEDNTLLSIGYMLKVFLW